MKTLQLPRYSIVPRALQFLVAAVGMAAASVSSAAQPVGQVGINISGLELGKGKPIHATSGAKVIYAGELYDFQVAGKFQGKPGTTLGKLIPSVVAFDQFLESISPGSSAILKGKFSNPSGKLPVTLFDKSISGKKVVGKTTIKLGIKLVGKIDKKGQCSLDVTISKLSVSPKPPLPIGTLLFRSGTKLLISASPTITFRRLNTVVEENAGSVSVTVWRKTNYKGKATVKYHTVNGTASSFDFTPVTEGSVTFKDGESQKNIIIPILDNVENDGSRNFSIVISDPSGALLGAQTSTMVTIDDND